jgi:hypothetical protein
MRVRARARQRGVELPLVISDHADWDGLTATIAATGASEVWVTHGEEDALVHWCQTRGLKSRPLRLVGYGEEEDDAAEPAAQDGDAGPPAGEPELADPGSSPGQSPAPAVSPPPAAARGRVRKGVASPAPEKPPGEEA